ncbi:hypothetical protein P9597_15265 [Aneurinibacillus migulanus]|uniref:hypothetical protein n=1 Tax=Aneurinibacillus migulanus TaxID=47500 RepID=UPI002E200FBC|nr:hypothetical protein [Aneurinibacillus migulanus]
MNILQATSHRPFLSPVKPWVDTTHPLAVIGARRFLSLPYYQAKIQTSQKNNQRKLYAYSATFPG